jgi:hypothetical protein
MIAFSLLDKITIDKIRTDTLHANPIGYITPRSLTWSNNFHNLPSSHTVISSYRVIWLNSWQLRLTKTVSFKQFLLLVLRENLVLWYLLFK